MALVKKHVNIVDECNVNPYMEQYNVSYYASNA